MVTVHGNDIVKACDRPERAEGALGLVVYRILLPQPGENRAPRVLLVKVGITDVDVFQWRGRHIYLNSGFAHVVIS